jgi:DNA polymerase III subunit epsilon
MLIIGTDVETTGLEIGDHRIIEYYDAAWLWDLHSKPELIDQTYFKINPERNIPLESQRIHHITPADVEGCPPWRKVAPEIHRSLARADLVVAHNGKSFDLPFLNYEFARVGLEELDPPLVDTMLEGRWATPQGKVPNLGELCFACDVPYDTTSGKAHAADYDVGVMMQCFFRALSWGWFKLPSPLEKAA